MSDWRTIDSAPRDLSEVMVFCPAEGVVVAQFEPGAAEPHWNFDVHDLLANGKTRCNPTHWMPLPPPPHDPAQTINGG